MKAIFIALLLIPIITNAAFDDAVNAYDQGDYQTALELYSAVYGDSTSAGLLYNIGNCYFKLNQLGNAILFYERAIQLAPADEDIQNNLNYANQQIVDRIAELPSLEIGNYWERLKAGSDVDQWARVSLFTWLFLFLLLAGSLFVKGNLRKILVGLSAILLITALLAIYMAYAQKTTVLYGKEAIIMKGRVEVKSAPGSGGSKLFILHEGTKVGVLRDERDWTEVKLTNGNVGWLQREGIEVI